MIRIALLLLISASALQAAEYRKAASPPKEEAAAAEEDPFARLRPYFGKWKGKHKCRDGMRDTHDVYLRRDKKKKRLIVSIRGRAPAGSTRTRTPGNIGRSAGTIYIKPTKRKGRFTWSYRLPATSPIAAILKIKRIKGTLRASKGGRVLAMRTSMGSIDNFYLIEDIIELSPGGGKFSHRYRETTMGKVVACGGDTFRIRSKKKKKRYPGWKPLNRRMPTRRDRSGSYSAQGLRQTRRRRLARRTAGSLTQRARRETT